MFVSSGMDCRLVEHELPDRALNLMEFATVATTQARDERQQTPLAATTKKRPHVEAPSSLSEVPGTLLSP